MYKRQGVAIISYGNPVKITGPRGPPGNSTTFIYQAVLSSDPAPGVPSGGEWEGDEPRSFNLPTLNRGWSRTPPLRLAVGEVLYLSEVTLPGIGTDHRGSITYKPAFQFLVANKAIKEFRVNKDHKVLLVL